jgi:hypothetical protein
MPGRIAHLNHRGDMELLEKTLLGLLHVLYVSMVKV